MADLTDDELLEQLSAKPDCGCLTCRMVHEIQRRRAAHEGMRGPVGRITNYSVLLANISVIGQELREIVRNFNGAEAK